MQVLCLDFFLALLLLIEELGIIADTANGRLCIGANLYKIKLLFASESERIARIHDCGGDVVAYDSYCQGADLSVNVVTDCFFLVTRWLSHLVYKCEKRGKSNVCRASLQVFATFFSILVSFRPLFGLLWLQILRE